MYGVFGALFCVGMTISRVKILITANSGLISNIPVAKCYASTKVAQIFSRKICVSRLKFLSYVYSIDICA